MPTKKRARGNASSLAEAALAAAAASAAAGYYFYGTKNAKKHRHAASAWAKGMKRDVQKGVKSLRNVNAKTVARVVDETAAAYQGARGVAKSDVRTAAKELKRNWSRVKSELTPSATVKRAVKRAKRVVAGARTKKRTTRRAVGKKKAAKKKRTR